MKRVISLALLAFALATFPPVQNASETSRGKGEESSPTWASASPESLDFGDQESQTISEKKIITLTNKTGKAIEIGGVDTGGGDREDFDVDDEECTDMPIQAGKSCSISVVFFPLEVGTRSSFLVITYDNPDHPQKIPLRGNGLKSNIDAGQQRVRR